MHPHRYSNMYTFASYNAKKLIYKVSLDKKKVVLKILLSEKLSHTYASKINVNIIHVYIQSHGILPIHYFKTESFPTFEL